MARNEIASALIETLIQSGSSDGDWDAANIVDAIGELSRAIIKLGNNDATTPMGGMEALGKAILDASENIKNGLYELAEAIRDMKSEE